ncbi:hypothetical protein [Nesterenkonia suensis]
MDEFDDVLVGEAVARPTVVSWRRAGMEIRLIVLYVRWRISQGTVSGRWENAPPDLLGYESELQKLDALPTATLVAQFDVLVQDWADALRPAVLDRSARKKISRRRTEEVHPIVPS